jgi:hypothetical protein
MAVEVDARALEKHILGATPMVPIAGLSSYSIRRLSDVHNLSVWDLFRPIGCSIETEWQKRTLEGADRFLKDWIEEERGRLTANAVAAHVCELPGRAETRWTDTCWTFWLCSLLDKDIGGLSLRRRNGRFFVVVLY